MAKVSAAPQQRLGKRQHGLNSTTRKAIWADG